MSSITQTHLDTAAALENEAVLALEETEPKASLARRIARSVLPGTIAFAVVFGIWQIGVDVSHVSPIELVSPSSIFHELWRNPSLYWDSAWVTGQEAFWGFIVAFVVAIGAAVVIAHSRIMERALAPLVVMLQVTPIIALGPPLVIWLGFGPQPKIVLAALITFVPLLTNAVVGFRAVDPSTLEVMRSVNASKVDVFLRLRVPHSLPYVLAATRICIGLALIGAVVAEFFGSSAGLGYVMVSGQKNLDVYEVWASIFVLIFMGVVGVSVVSLLGHRLLGWTEISPIL